MMDSQEVIIPSTQKPQNNYLIIILILIGILLAISLLYFGYQLSVSQNPTPINLTLTPIPTTQKDTWSNYTNNRYKFSLSHPQSWNFEEAAINELSELSKKDFSGFLIDPTKKSSVLFENKEYPKNVNSPQLNKWIEYGVLRPDYDGRLYGAIYFDTQDTKPEDFYKIYSHGNEDKSCGPHNVQDNDELVSLGNIKAIKTTSHAACDYEGIRKTTLHIIYKILIEDRENDNIANIYIIYDNSHPTISSELKIFNQILSTFKFLD